MKYLKGKEIRKMWLDFFSSKGHEVVESAPLIPINDPTLLWINAGVAPLKKYFDGTEIPKNKRLTNAQKSIRTNDIENVGRTARHHTFFEMLGNFSIGDYFRNEALEFAIEILTSPKWFDFSLDKLYFTVYPSDIDTINKWISLGVDPSHIIRLEDNFWEIGEGPCGPDTEIFFDRGETYDPDGLGIKLLEEDLPNERYIEIWNIVFSQFNSKPGVPRDKYKELPNKNIDTGMGLERMACVIQGTKTNYETDLFMPIIDKTSEIVGVKYDGQMAFKVIADHTRSVVFALSDGATFSNEGRGYVLRRLLRRAVRFGKKLGMNEPFLYKLVGVVVENMMDFYPYLVGKQELVTKQIKIEEEKFLNTLESGEKKLLDYINLTDSKVIEKEVAFLLYDTFGFPFELTVEVASEHGFTVDEKGFTELLQLQRKRAREARNSNESMNTQNEAMMKFTKESKFVGYTDLESNSKVVGIFKDGSLVDSANGEVIVVFDQTPFYGESGGQIGDIGILAINNKNYSVLNTFKLPNGQHGSIVNMNEDKLSVDSIVRLEVDEEFRNDVMKNHSATHLLNESLRKVIGSHVVQQGSFVSNNFLRFDFNNFNPLTSEEILKIEALVNEEIKKGNVVNIKEMPIADAKKLNVQAVFGEKYGDIVRVVDMDFSRELCGGTHVKNTKDIEKFAILSIETKGSGIFRVEASTGSNIISELEKTLENIHHDINNNLEKINNIVSKAKENGINLEFNNFELSPIVESYQLVLNRRNELEILRNNSKELEKTFNKLMLEKNSLNMDKYINDVIKIDNNNIVIIKENDLNIDSAKELVDRLTDHLPNSLIFMAIISDKVVFLCKNKISKLHAGNLVKLAAVTTSGNGGGRNDFAQAGGKDISKVDEALELVLNEVKRSL